MSSDPARSTADANAVRLPFPELPAALALTGCDDLAAVLAATRKAIAISKRSGKRWRQSMLVARKRRSRHSAVAMGRRPAGDGA